MLRGFLSEALAYQAWDRNRRLLAEQFDDLDLIRDLFVPKKVVCPCPGNRTMVSGPLSLNVILRQKLKEPSNQSTTLASRPGRKQATNAAVSSVALRKRSFHSFVTCIISYFIEDSQFHSSVKSIGELSRWRYHQ